MNFENTDFRIEEIDKENPYDLKLIKDFLNSQGFDYKEDEVDSSILLYNLNDQIIGTGSYRKMTLKYVCVAPKFQGTTAFAQIVTCITNKLLKTYKHTFVYTKPVNAKLFESLGYSEIARAEPVFSVLEFGYRSISDYQAYLQNNKKQNYTNNISAIVVNCNPFTNGHKYLIEKASRESELVYLFVVEENLSVFPFEVRWRLIKEGTKHLKNITMLKTGPYIVSGAIFPNYFLKNESFDLVSQKQAEIDVTIFVKYIASVLKIKKRYVGTENYCVTTAAYNEAMRKILPENNIKVIEVERKAIGMTDENKKNYISASKVRLALKENRLNEIIEFVPQVTAEFLQLNEAKEIIESIKKSKGRH